MATEIAELDFSLDDFHNQKVLRGADAYARLIQRLLFMRKGTYPTIPDMGIDISSYRFADLDVVFPLFALPLVMYYLLISPLLEI